MEYDNSNRGAAWMTFMRIRVEVDTDIPLKRWKKVGQKTGCSFLVRFKYEKLYSFYFVCGILGHTKNFCELLFASPDAAPKCEWGIFLRAPDRRGKTADTNRWLRDSVGGMYGGDASMDSNSGIPATDYRVSHMGNGDKGVAYHSGFQSHLVVSSKQQGTNFPGVNSILVNPIFEPEIRNKILEENVSTGEEERKRKRGKMHVGYSHVGEQAHGNNDDNIGDSPIYFLTVDLEFGACREL
ncbi:hypothetical protein ACS0TY_024523 [Phlomoides rotata]